MRINCIILALLLSLGASAQTRKGDVFISERKTTARDTVVTKYKYEVKGEQYPIIVNRKTGACYVCKVSKNGNWYRMYLNKEIKEAICKELNITK